MTENQFHSRGVERKSSNIVHWRTLIARQLSVVAIRIGLERLSIAVETNDLLTAPEPPVSGRTRE
jgi:hypothetical protein